MVGWWGQSAVVETVRDAESAGAGLSLQGCCNAPGSGASMGYRLLRSLDEPAEQADAAACGGTTHLPC